MNYTLNGMVTDPGEISAMFGASVEEPETNAPEEKKNKGEDTPPDNPDNEEHITDEEPTTIEDLFPGGETTQERVGNEDNPEEGSEREPSEKKGGSSPAKLYSSIANSLAEDGALSNLSDEDLKEVKDVETLVAAMKKQMQSMLDETQQRVSSALDAGLEPSQIRNFEGAIQYLDTVTEEMLTAETADGEKLRRGLIEQYYMNLGESEDKAKKMAERAVNGGTDVEDAKEYLEALKTSYKEEYQRKIEEGKNAVQNRRKQQEEEIKRFKNTLLTEKNILGDIEVDEKTRKLAFDNWMRPTHRTEQGTYQSEIQKYISENPADFQMKVALLFTMTDGFKNMGNVLKQTVKKEKKKAMQELENVVNNTQRNPSGGLNLFGGKDPDSNFRGSGLQFAPPETWQR